MLKLGNTAHQADVRYLQRLMDDPPFVHTRTEEDNAAYDVAHAAVAQRPGRADGERHPQHRGPHVLGRGVHPLQVVRRHSHHESLLATLGGS